MIRSKNLFAISQPSHCLSEADPDLQIWGVGGGGRGGHLDPEIRRGPGLKTKFFRPFGPHFGPQIRGVTEPLDPPLGSLSKDVFERRTLAGSETFSFFIRLDANKFVLLSSFSLIKAICPRVWTKPLPNNPNSPLPVDVRRPKTLLLKLPSGSSV